LLIGIKDFQKLRWELKSIKDLYRFPYSRGALFTILSQKRVDMVKKKHPVAVQKLNVIENYWKSKKRLPPWLDLTPVMRMRLLLKAIGYSKSEIRNSIQNPSRVDNERLEYLIWKSLFTDYIYSPLAVRHQFARGKLGEKIIKVWLENREIDFKDEYEMRGEKKTPDFFFPEPLRVNEKLVKWIESKALFGDPKTHRFYSKKQYLRYQELFGDGYVVYWFGYVRGLNSNVNILSDRFFNSSLRGALLDMKFFTAGVSAFRSEKFKRILPRLSIKSYVNLGCETPFESVESPELMERENFHEYMKTKDFLDGMNKLIDLYSHGRVMLVCKENDWRRCHRRHISWVLRNLGFDMVHLRAF
jgi:hypothetical protein